MIQLYIHKESDLYNPYDPTQTKINDLVYNYLKSYFTHTEYEDHIQDTLQLTTDSPIDLDKFKAALQGAVKKEQDEYDFQLAVNKKRITWSYIVGILLSLAGVALSLITDQVLLALISFFGTRTLSDGIALQTQDNPDIKRLKKRLDPLHDLTLEIVETGAQSVS